MDQCSDIMKLCGDRLTLLSGDDPLAVPLMAIGAKGVISVVTNVMPREVHEMVAAGLAGIAVDAAAPGRIAVKGAISSRT